MIGLVAILKVKPEMADAFEASLKELQKTVRAEEPGCTQYDFFKHSTEENTYVMMEQYKTQADADAHMASPHFQAAAAGFGDVLSEAPALHFLQHIS